MPFLRVIRDKRGYETTYLMHVYRDGNRQQTRILYAFRTPSGVHVGREPLEPDVVKQLEAQYRDLEFDWNAVFQSRQVIEPGVDTRRPRKRSPEEATPESRAPRQAPSQPQQQAPLPTIPSVIEGDTPDARVAFLTHWSVVVRERIERMSDPARREPLLALADRLNPAAWTDIDQITAGLQEASEALERLSHVLARRRRRTKKRSGPLAETPMNSTAPEGSDNPAAESVAAESDQSDSQPDEPAPDA